MKKNTLGIIGLCFISTYVCAVDLQKDGENIGKVDLSIKAITVLAEPMGVRFPPRFAPKITAHQVINRS